MAATSLSFFKNFKVKIKLGLGDDTHELLNIPMFLNSIRTGHSGYFKTFYNENTTFAFSN